MRIAICDDDKLSRSEVTQLLKAYIQQSGREISLSVYENGTELLEDARRTSGFEIYILDVLMPLLNGIDLGVQLRELDPDSKIIYLSSSPDYAVRATRARVWEYLLKPVDPGALFSSLEEAFAVLTEKRENSMVVKTGQSSIHLSFDNILYAQLNKKNVHYHLVGGKVVESTSIRTSFSEAVQEMLRDNRFYMCSSSTVINLYHVSEITTDSLTFHNGVKLYLSKQASRELRPLWGSFWINKEGRK